MCCYYCGGYVITKEYIILKLQELGPHSSIIDLERIAEWVFNNFKQKGE